MVSTDDHPYYGPIEIVEEYGIQFGDGEVDDGHPTQAEAEAEIAQNRRLIRENMLDGDDYEPMAVVKRTTYRIQPTAWEPA